MPTQTIYDIAKRAGVGIATVSRVLNGHSNVSESTRAAVRKAMAELGYRPNRAARRLAVGGPNRSRVAALVPFFSTSFYFTVARPIARELQAKDVDLVLYDVVDRSAKNRLLDRIVAERAAEGVILCSMGIGTERQEQLRTLGIHHLFVDYPMPTAPSIAVDNVEGGAMAARTLLARGATRLGLVTGPAAVHAFADRERGFRAVADAAAPIHRTSEITPESGADAARALLRQAPAIDGIACVNDALAVGVVEALRHAGRRVPDEVQVLGFDDQPLMDQLGLSTIRQPMTEFGNWAARNMLIMLKRPRTGIESVRLELEVVLRRTTR